MRQAVKTPSELEAFRVAIIEKQKAFTRTVNICVGTGCAAKGSEKLYELFQKAADDHNSGNGKDVFIKAKCVGCRGLCSQGPIITVLPEKILYTGVTEADVEEIFTETILNGRIVERLLYINQKTADQAETEDDIPFLHQQRRIVLAQNGRIDPTNIEDYIEVGGYSALVKAISSMTPEQVIDEIEISGLRGRGGGGFPTGRKWKACREADGAAKYVICNGDEGDPEAFKDKAVMEGNPHVILEGLIIGAYAIGASNGYIYVRNEYPIAVSHLKNAIEQCRSLGLLGENILGSGFCFEIRINRGGGAFVSGESTALLASLEGKQAEPRAKYVHAVEIGLNGMPTVLNNVETWANVAGIVTNGGKWFSSIGANGSKGTKIISLAGKVVNTGLVEIPMGTTFKEIVEDIGGGIKDGKKLKAIQTGGPSGGCIPSEFLNTPVDFSELSDLGSMLGSGGIIAMDEDTCMAGVARNLLTFLLEESCGKCSTCREGIAQMVAILERITSGKGAIGDLDTLEQLAVLLTDTALCAFGRTAANPVLSTMRYFRTEYEAHINDKHCPAKECKGLFLYDIDAVACTGCGVCKKNCPVNAITGERKEPHTIHQNICTKCGTCYEKCRFTAILKV